MSHDKYFVVLSYFCHKCFASKHYCWTSYVNFAETLVDLACILKVINAHRHWIICVVCIICVRFIVYFCVRILWRAIWWSWNAFETFMNVLQPRWMYALQNYIPFGFAHIEFNLHQHIHFRISSTRIDFSSHMYTLICSRSHVHLRSDRLYEIMITALTSETFELEK